MGSDTPWGTGHHQQMHIADLQRGRVGREGGVGFEHYKNINKDGDLV